LKDSKNLQMMHLNVVMLYTAKFVFASKRTWKNAVPTGKLCENFACQVVRVNYFSSTFCSKRALQSAYLEIAFYKFSSP